MTQFSSETTEPESDTAQRFKQLVGLAQIEDGEIQVAEDAPSPEEHALAYYQHIVDTDTETVRERWHNALERAHKVAAEFGVANALDDLEIQGLQTVVFGFQMYRDFAERVEADMSQLPTEDDLQRALEHVIDRIGPLGKRKSHADRFIELFGRAAAANYIERGTHYEIVRECQPDEELRINLPRAYDALSKYAKDHDIRSDDLLNDHKDYRDRFRELAENPGSYVESVMQYTPGVSKCTGISTVKAMNELEFNRSVVADGEISGESETTESGPDADGGSGNVQAAADGGGEYDNLPSKELPVSWAEVAIARRMADRKQPEKVGEIVPTIAENYDVAPDKVKAALESGSSDGDFILEGDEVRPA